MKTFIYGLIDPQTLEVRYIGKANNPYDRFNGHLKSKRLSHKYYWIQSLLKQGLKPNYCILEQCDENIWQEREKNWIAFGRKLKWPLTNDTEGGDGSCGLPCSDERKRKIGEANRGKKNGMFGRKGFWKGKHLLEETKTKIREARKNQKPPMLGRHLSKETKEKLSKALKGKFHHSEETKRKISKSHKKLWKNK